MSENKPKRVLTKYLKVHRCIDPCTNEEYPITDLFGELISYFGLGEEEPKFSMLAKDCNGGLLKAKEISRDTCWRNIEYVNLKLGNDLKAEISVRAKYWDAQPKIGVSNE